MIAKRRINIQGNPNLDARTLQLEFDNIYSFINTISKRIDTISAITASVSTAPTVSGNYNVRNGANVTVAQGANTIVFITPLASSSYTIVCQARMTDNTSIQLNVTAKSATGFTVLASDAGTLDYVAVELI